MAGFALGLCPLRGLSRYSRKNAWKCLSEKCRFALENLLRRGKMKRKRTMGSLTHVHQPGLPATPACQLRGFIEGDHQIEKLEFALAVAISRGDAARIEELRLQIAALGDNREEPGT
jgi:hypothetical protein